MDIHRATRLAGASNHMLLDTESDLHIKSHSESRLWRHGTVSCVPILSCVTEDGSRHALA